MELLVMAGSSCPAFSVISLPVPVLPRSVVGSTTGPIPLRQPPEVQDLRQDEEVCLSFLCCIPR